jgi:NAD(P)-dependent dehydrogenase (short-subunit alcohol dehydrogenase family)
MMENYATLTGKTILITGASSGIGRQCAISCSRMGGRLILIALEEDKLEQTISLLEGDNHQFYVQDITKYDRLEPVILASFEKSGPIHGFIHSAGIEMNRPLKILKAENYEKVIAVNAISGFEIIRILSKIKYLPPEGASYVLISSVMGTLGDIGNIAYCSSKGALLSAGKAMALELASKKVRVNCVLPGVVVTEMSQQLFQNISEDSKNMIIKMHPLGLGRPEDVANACVFLLSDASRWITGTNFYVDGGYSAH